jgi:3-methylfumaryl-CoA hydratase
MSTDVVTLSPVRRLAATLDLPEPHERSPLPPLWHWLFCLPDEPTARLGADGHPLHGRISARVEGVRRMYAGGEFEFHDEVRIGDELSRRSRLERVVEKDGRNGPLAFLTWVHEWSTGRAPAVTERQHLVYTDSPPAIPAESEEPVPFRPWSETLRPDERMLFRFSALTFNTHRIHYDAAFTRDVEGYPGIIVHGPLLALALAGLALRGAGAVPRHYEFRAVSPAFVGGDVTLTGQPTDSGVELEAFTASGRTAMRAVYRM